MEFSKNIEHGSVVAWKGEKIILASKRTKSILGVYNFDSFIRGFTSDGERFSFEIPAGVRTRGEANVKIMLE